MYISIRNSSFKAVLILLGFASFSQPLYSESDQANEFRVWTDSAGRKIEARYAPELAGEDDVGLIILQKNRGGLIKVKPERLSDADNAYIGEQKVFESFGSEDGNTSSIGSTQYGSEKNANAVMYVNSREEKYSPVISSGNKDASIVNEVTTSENDSPGQTDFVNKSDDIHKVLLVDTSDELIGVYSSRIELESGGSANAIGIRFHHIAKPGRSTDRRLEYYELEDVVIKETSPEQINDINVFSYEINFYKSKILKYNLEPYVGIGLNTGMLWGDDSFGFHFGGKVALGVMYTFKDWFAVFIEGDYRRSISMISSTTIDDEDEFGDLNDDLLGGGLNLSYGILFSW